MRGGEDWIFCPRGEIGLPRIGCIDVGTNSVLLLVADIEGDSLHPVVDEAEITRLGAGVDRTRQLQEESIRTTLGALQKFRDQAKDLGAGKVMAIGTSALRDAENSQAFLEPARQILGEPVQIISGEQEAHASWLSVETDPSLNARVPMLVADLGGGSTELVGGSGWPAGLAVSVDMGAVRLTERFFPTQDYTPEAVHAARAAVRNAFEIVLSGQQYKTFVGIGGTVVNLACMAAGVLDHTRTHGFRLSRRAIAELAGRLSSLSLEKRRNVPGLEPKRADVIVSGALIFEVLMEILGLDELVTSTRGVRYGAAVLVSRGEW